MRLFLALIFTLTLAACSHPATAPVQTGESSSGSSSTMVLICVSPTAHKYHSYHCRGLDRCTHDIQEVTLEEAHKRGYTPCNICYR